MGELPSEMGEASQCCCDCDTMMPMECPEDCDEDGENDKEQIKEADAGDGPDLDANNDGVLDGTPCDCDSEDDEGEGQ